MDRTHTKSAFIALFSPWRLKVTATQTKSAVADYWKKGVADLNVVSAHLEGSLAQELDRTLLDRTSPQQLIAASPLTQSFSWK